MVARGLGRELQVDHEVGIHVAVGLLADVRVQTRALELVQRGKQHRLRRSLHPCHPCHVRRRCLQRVRQHANEERLRGSALANLGAAPHAQEDVRIPADRRDDPLQFVILGEAAKLQEVWECGAHVAPAHVFLPTFGTAEKRMSRHEWLLQPRHDDVPDTRRTQCAASLREPLFHLWHHLVELFVRSVESGAVWHRREAIWPDHEFNRVHCRLLAIEGDGPRQHCGQIAERWHHIAYSLARRSRSALHIWVLVRPLAPQPRRPLVLRA
mmetsp:Transcript_49636/g.138941  ORF Transcript_49636/g.138941 Transcript_49636/m.138941 type:complete len:268 (+) Transcript_49636:2451-3254(+)